VVIAVIAIVVIVIVVAIVIIRAILYNVSFPFSLSLSLF
jgi:hypothetical protein